MARLRAWLFGIGLVFNTIAFGAMWLPSVLAILTGQWPWAVSSSAGGLWMAFGALVSFPWVAGVSGVMAWRLFGRGASGLGLGLSCLPYANVGLFALGLRWATTAS